MRPRVSVIVPVYKVEKYLEKCVKSILSQTFTDFECILVDDGSPDNCPQICDEFARLDRRVTVIHKKQNGGLPQARKTGFESSSGMYILFADSDDWIESVMIEKMYNKAINDNYDMVICDFFINEDSKQIQYFSPAIFDKTAIMKTIIMFKKYSPSVWNKLVKRDIYEKVVFPFCNYIEDRVIMFQTIYYTQRIAYLPDALYHYYQNALSISSSNLHDEYIMDEYNNFFLALRFFEDTDIAGRLEPELSSRVNAIKLSILKKRKLRPFFNEAITVFYPSSTKNIFRKRKGIGLLYILLLFLAVKNSSPLFLLVDSCFFFENVLKRIYRLVIPKKIRMMIWSTRHKNI
jgi:glycosyltransferase involved in cell wall biosynthesis